MRATADVLDSVAERHAVLAQRTAHYRMGRLRWQPLLLAAGGAALVVCAWRWSRRRGAPDPEVAAEPQPGMREWLQGSVMNSRAFFKLHLSEPLQAIWAELTQRTGKPRA